MVLTKTENCFVCGEKNRKGLQAAFQTNSDLLCSFGSVVLAETFQGWGNIVHGGILAALLDEACIYAAMSLEKQAVTAELQIRYRKPVPCGCQVTLFGEVISHRKQIVLARARLVLGGEIYTEAEARIFLSK
jgi:uncharacterized protein (TIGR00369 family)